MNGSISPSTARDTAVVLRQLGWSVAELIISGTLLTASFLVHVQNELFHDVTRGGGIGSLVVVILTGRFRYEVRSGRVTTRQQLRKTQSADLTRLADVWAPGQAEKFWGATLFGKTRYLELRDKDGSAVRLTFFGTPRAQRRRFLAALEPYVMADGVTRTGLVGQALSGELWSPRPRPS